MSLRQEYIEFFLNGKVETAEIETLEISHPAFSRVYYLVRNVTGGITLRHEDGQEYYHEYCPLSLANEGASDDLDYALSISLGDLNEIISREVDNLLAADSFGTPATVIWRSYRSDTLEIMNGPLRLEAREFSYTGEGSSFPAGAPQVNRQGTGLRYDLTNFPATREFMK